MIFVHVASYKDEFFNGIKSVLEELVPEQRKLGHDVYVFNQEYNEKEIISGEIYISSSQEFKDAINEIKPEFVIFHSLYGLSDVRYSWYLNKNKIPYFVEPHGGTSIENAKKNWFKKKVANYLYANRFIRKAVGLIYLNKKEQEECVFNKIRRDSVIIPNGTHIHQHQKCVSTGGKVRFIFLARIDIIQKGLDLLFPAIEAFNCCSGMKDKVEFHFYGKARNPQYAQVFEQYISEASDNVFFHGPVIGEDKDKAFQDADIFILPSRYEGMPMAVLEALSFGLPCILSRQTNVADIIKQYNCGWITNTTVEDIRSSILLAIDDLKSRRKELMNNALEAAKLFDWNAVAANSIKEYARLAVK